MKVIVSGGRDFTDRQYLFDRMDDIHAVRPITLVIEGGQRTRKNGQTVGGADYWASRWAQWRGILVVREDANWDDLDAPRAHIVVKHGRPYNKNAGPERNARMIALYNPDALVVFAGGRGTADMVAKAVAAGLDIIEG